MTRIQGAGLGVRRAFIDELVQRKTIDAEFMELAPENWIRLGGRFGQKLEQLANRVPLVCHGLSLSLGGPTPLDQSLLHDIKEFIKRYNISIYSEHLSYCSDHGHLYDLMPIPFTLEAARYVADRIIQVQDLLQQRIAIENVSYYAAPGQEMAEIDFINTVIDLADCDLLLDINNIYVNSINHGYNAEAFLRALPGHRVAYCHIAGHYQETPNLIVDTHGAPVVTPVWQLLEKAYQIFGVMPTLLERDFNFPPLDELFAEMQHISVLQQPYLSTPSGLSSARHPNWATQSLSGALPLHQSE